MKKLFFFVSAALVLAACSAPEASTESSANPADKILLTEFNPQVINNIPVTYVERAKFDIIDMHAHDYAANAEEVAQWCETMDKVGVLNTAVMHCSWIGRPFE